MCKDFYRICTKVYNPCENESQKVDIVESIALLEMEFPLSEHKKLVFR